VRAPYETFLARQNFYLEGREVTLIAGRLFFFHSLRGPFISANWSFKMTLFRLRFLGFCFPDLIRMNRYDAVPTRGSNFFSAIFIPFPCSVFSPYLFHLLTFVFLILFDEPTIRILVNYVDFSLLTPSPTPISPLFFLVRFKKDHTNCNEAFSPPPRLSQYSAIAFFLLFYLFCFHYRGLPEVSKMFLSNQSFFPTTWSAASFFICGPFVQILGSKHTDLHAPPKTIPRKFWTLFPPSYGFYFIFLLYPSGIVSALLSSIISESSFSSTYHQKISPPRQLNFLERSHEQPRKDALVLCLPSPVIFFSRSTFATYSSQDANLILVFQMTPQCSFLQSENFFFFLSKAALF